MKLNTMRVDTGRLRVVAGDAPEAKGGMLDELPESGASPGAYVSDQRQRRGMSLEQLAVATKIPRRQLQLLEDDRFDELPGAVFVKGFFRCCARALDLEEETVLGLLYEQEREAMLARRREVTASTGKLGQVGGPSSAEGPSRRRTRTNVQATRSGLGRWFEGLSTSRLLMWAIVVLVVAVIVMLAFTLAVAGGNALMQS